MTIKKILVPLDGSENAEKVGGWVAGIALPLGAEVILTTVINPDGIDLPESTAEHGHPIPGRRSQYDRPGHETTQALAGVTGLVGGTVAFPDRGDKSRRAPVFGTQILDRTLQQADGYLEREADRLDASGVKASFKALTGDPAEAIVSFATRAQVDMIAMATHRGSAIARGVLGSVTDRVIRSSHVPVLAVHPESLSAFSGAHGQPEVVVVPFDGSARSESALETALDIAQACGSEVLFLRVAQYPYYGVTAMGGDYYNTEEGTSYQRREAEEYLEPLVADARQRGLNARQVVLTGVPGERILDHLKGLSRPLVVMSTRGSSGVRRWVLGSVTDKVIRSSGLPVLVVPPAAK